MKRAVGILALLAVGSIIMFTFYKMGVGTSNGKERRHLIDIDPDAFVSDLYDEQNGGFGSDRVKEGQDAKPVAFDGKRAIKYLKAICELGPRISGSKAMRQQQQLIKKHFEELGAKVVFQTFTAKQNSVKGEVEMTNIIVSFQPDKKRRVILCSHYDTRPIADQEPDPRDWHKPFLSANDGGTGVAFMMEMGIHMKGLTTNIGVDFVIFDGEEYIYKTEGPSKDRYFIGSQHFGETWRKTKDHCEYSAAILLDMIAGKDLRLPVEINSYRRSRELCAEVYRIASEQKATAFQWREGHEVLDDHIMLQKVGIPAIDLIDFDYAHWHKLTDRPENCSAESMEQVARVLSVWLQRTK